MDNLFFLTDLSESGGDKHIILPFVCNTTYLIICYTHIRMYYYAHLGEKYV